MITDMSHIGKNFMLTTLRPSIYFRPWSDAAAFPYANSYPRLIAALEQALELPPLDAAALDTELGFLPVENATRDLARAIPDFIDARPHDDWLIIERDKNSPGASLLKRIRTILAMKDIAATYAKQFAWYGNSRSLAVLALHLHRLQAPQTAILSWLAALAGYTTTDRCYADISTDELLSLYDAAEREESLHSRQPEQIKQQDLVALRKLSDCAARKASTVAMHVIFSKSHFSR